jgi:hypothetical protein
LDPAGRLWLSTHRPARPHRQRPDRWRDCLAGG